MTTARRGRPPTIDRDRIVECALALIERVGVDGLTMKGLAEELGVTPMAAYRYVDNKQALIELIVGVVLSRTSAPEEGTWQDRLWGLTWGSVQEMARYPGLAEYLYNGSITDPGRQALQDGFDILCEGGMTPEQANVAYSDVYAYMLGRLVLRSRATARAGATRTGERLGVPSLFELSSEEHVRHGYDALVTGLVSMAAQPRRARRLLR